MAKKCQDLYLLSFEKLIPTHRFKIGLSAPRISQMKPNTASTSTESPSWVSAFDWVDFGKRDFGSKMMPIAALMAEAYFWVLQGMKKKCRIANLGTGVAAVCCLMASLSGIGNKWRDIIGLSTVQLVRHWIWVFTGIPGEFGICNWKLFNSTKENQGTFPSTLNYWAYKKGGHILATWIWLDMMRTLCAIDLLPLPILSPEASRLSGGLTHAGNILFEPLQRFYWPGMKFRPQGKANQNLGKQNLRTFSGAIGAAKHLLWIKYLNQTKPILNELHSTYSRYAAKELLDLHPNSRIRHSNRSEWFSKSILAVEWHMFFGSGHSRIYGGRNVATLWLISRFQPDRRLLWPFTI